MPPAARTKKHAAGGTSKTNKSRTNAGASKRTRALDTSLDGVEPLNISWQLGSDAGMLNQQDVEWTAMITNEVRKKHRMEAEQVIKNSKADEARIFKRQEGILKEFEAEFNKLQADLFAQLGVHSTGIVKALTRRMAHDKHLCEKTGGHIKDVVQAVQVADGVGDGVVEALEAAIREEELIGETANLRLSALNDDSADFLPTRTDGKPRSVLEPVNANTVATKIPIVIKNKPSKRPRKTDDTLVDFDVEDGL